MPKKLLFLLLSCISCGYSTLGQKNLPPVYEIQCDTAYEQTLDSIYWQVLEDKSGKLTIDQVNSPAVSDNFRTIKANELDTTLQTYWFRYRLKNVMNKHIHIALDSRASRSDFYLFGDSMQERHFVTGDKLPWIKKNGLTKGNYIPVILKPQEELLLYYRVFNTKSGLYKNFKIDFVNTEKEMLRELNDSDQQKAIFGKIDVQEAFVIGLLFLTILFNILFFWVNRDKSNALFAIFVFFLGLNKSFNILSEYPSVLKYIPFTGYGWILISLFLVLFIREFFGTKQLFRRWDKWLIGLAFINTLIGVIEVISGQPASSLLHIPFRLATLPEFLLIPVSMLITLILFIRKRNTTLLLLIIGISPLLLFSIVSNNFSEYLGVLNHESAFLEITRNYRLVEVLNIIWLTIFSSLSMFLRYTNSLKDNALRNQDQEAGLK